MLLITVPCYNEASRLDSNAFLAFLNDSPDAAIIFVDDGSTDATLGKLRALQAMVPQRVDVLALGANVGKAEAVRSGVRRALETDPELIGFWDADLSTPLKEVVRFSAALGSPGIDVVIGSRVKRLGADIERKWYRHYPGRIIATAISQITDLPVYDSQCGAKIFRRAIAEEIFREPFVSSWLFDVEILARIKTCGNNGGGACKRVVEIPLEKWSDVPGSKIRLSYLFRIPAELLRIHRRYNVGIGR